MNKPLIFKEFYFITLFIGGGPNISEKINHFAPMQLVTIKIISNYHSWISETLVTVIYSYKQS